MPKLLFVGETGFTYMVPAVHRFNRCYQPKEPWMLEEVPSGSFTSQPGWFERWLTGKVPGHSPAQSGYDATVIEDRYADLAPVLKRVHPEMPTVLFNCGGAKPDGIDAVVDYSNRADAILKLMPTVDRLVAGKR